MDTDTMRLLEEEVKVCKSIAVAANYLFLKTADHGFSRDCCWLWATYILYPSLRPWVRKVVNSAGYNNIPHLT